MSPLELEKKSSLTALKLHQQHPAKQSSRSLFRCCIASLTNSTNAVHSPIAREPFVVLFPSSKSGGDDIRYNESGGAASQVDAIWKEEEYQ